MGIYTIHQPNDSEGTAQSHRNTQLSFPPPIAVEGRLQRESSIDAGYLDSRLRGNDDLFEMCRYLCPVGEGKSVRPPAAGSTRSLPWFVGAKLINNGIDKGMIDHLLDADITFNKALVFEKLQILLQAGFVNLAVGIVTVRSNRLVYILIFNIGIFRQNRNDFLCLRSGELAAL